MTGIVDWAGERARMVLAFIFMTVLAGGFAYATLPKEGEPIWAAPIVTAPAAAVILLGGAFIFGWALLPFVIVAALLTLGLSAFRRPGLAVFVIIGLIYIPLAGTFSLWDPWETHYGEVAREILARDDWISLWWCQENWFWSKPILIFWSDALSMGALGIDFSPDSQMFHSEWALRLPIITMAMTALLAVYQAMSRFLVAQKISWISLIASISSCAWVALTSTLMVEHSLAAFQKVVCRFGYCSRWGGLK